MAIILLAICFIPSVNAHDNSPSHSAIAAPFHMASAGLSTGNATNAASSVAYDEQIGETFTQSFTGVAYNVTAVAQEDQNGYGPAYLLNGLTNVGYWYQIGLSWNWAELNGGYDAGFHGNYNVFNSGGNVVLPSNGSGGVVDLTGTVNQGDSVELSLQFSNGNVLMNVYDWNTGASAQVSYSAEGATEFVGLSAPANSNGFFTGLMTEQYHSSVYTGSEQAVTYSDTTFALSSAFLWIDEYNVNNLQSQFGGSSPEISFASNPSKLQSYSLDGATVTADASDTITGSVTSIQFTVSYSVVGGGTGYAAPTFTYVSDGIQQSVSLSSTPTAYSIDFGTAWSVTNPLSGSTTTERWISNQTTNGVATSSATMNFTYGNEYLVFFVSNPSSEGSTNPSGSNWYNAGQSYSMIATAISPYSLVSWTASAGLTISNPSSSSTTLLVGGSGTVTANFGLMSISLNAPASTITQGSSIKIGGETKGEGSAAITVSGLPSGATVTLPDGPLSLSLSGTPFALTIATTYTTQSGTFILTVTSSVAGTGNVSAEYTLSIREAVPLTLDYSVEGAGSGYSAPTLSYVYNGTSSHVSLGTSPGVIYVDQNTLWNVSDTLSGSTSTERWETNQSASGSAVSAATIDFVFYHQFLVTFSYSVSGGGSGYLGPAVSALQFGSKLSPTLGEQVWVDAGSQYSYANPLSGSTSSERWEANNSSSQILSSGTVSPTYFNQYYVMLLANAPAGGTLGPSSEWANSGSSVSISNLASSGWQFEFWTGSGSGSYSGSAGTTTVSVLAPITENATFYPGLTISTTARGSVSYSYGNSSILKTTGPVVVYVPIGTSVTLGASPSSIFYKLNSWTGAASGNSAHTSVSVISPSTVAAQFGYNLDALGGIIGVVGAAILCTVALIVARRPKRSYAD